MSQPLDDARQRDVLRLEAARRRRRLRRSDALVEGDSCSSCDGDVVASSGGVGGYINSRWSYSLNSVYEAPFKLMFGAAVVGREGLHAAVLPPRQQPRRHRQQEHHGRRRVRLEPPAGPLQSRPPRRRATSHIAGDHGAEFSVDLFNVTNERTVLWRDNRLYSADGPDIARTTGSNSCRARASGARRPGAILIRSQACTKRVRGFCSSPFFFLSLPLQAALTRFDTGNPADVAPQLHGPILHLAGGGGDVDAAYQEVIDRIRGCNDCPARRSTSSCCVLPARTATTTTCRPCAASTR